MTLKSRTTNELILFVQICMSEDMVGFHLILYEQTNIKRYEC